MPNDQQNLLNLLDLPKAIRDEIISYLDTGSLLSLSMTSTELNHQVKALADNKTVSVFPLKATAGLRYSLALSWHQGRPILQSCGRNEYGQLGLGDNYNRNRFTQVDPPKELVTINNVITSDFSYTLLLGSDAKNQPALYSCGNNGNGQLGLGDNINKNQFTQINLPMKLVCLDNVVTGIFHTLLLGRDTDGKPALYACGSNFNGELGLGDNSDKNQLTQIKLPKELFALDNVVAGGHHSLLFGRDIEDNPLLYACGRNDYGQLGLGHNSDKNCFTQVKLPKGLISINAITAGYYHTLFFGQNAENKGVLYVCGSNYNGKLGLGHNIDKNYFTEVSLPEELAILDSVSATCNISLLIGRNAENTPLLYECGQKLASHTCSSENQNIFAPLILPENFITLNNVVASQSHTLLIGRNSENKPLLSAIGRNNYYQLGLGDKEPRTSFTLVKDPRFFSKTKSIEALESYYTEEQASSEPHYIGFFKRLISGISKTEKLQAANAVIAFLKDDIPINRAHTPALNDGKLGQMIKERQLKLTFTDTPYHSQR